MPKIGVLLILAIISVASAQVGLPSWDWSTYNGTTQWVTTVTEDDSGCGGGTLTNQYTIDMNFTPGHALMGDVGHGSASGRVQNNVLSIPGRTVPDPPGSSTLSPYDITFTSDCLTFTGQYSWDYSGSDGDCSGTTTLSGRIVNGCPAPEVVPVVPPVNPPTTGSSSSELYDAHTDVSNVLQALNTMNSQQAQLDFEKRFPDEYPASDIKDLQAVVDSQKSIYTQLDPKVEAEYDTILQADPGNFWANWDMAQLKKAQGQYDQYYAYIYTAAQNTHQFEGTENTGLEQAVADSMGLEKFPTVDDSVVLREESNEINPWNGGPVYGQNLPADLANNPPAEHFTLVTLFSSKIYSIVNSLGGPGSQ